MEKVILQSSTTLDSKLKRNKTSIIDPGIF